MQRTAAIASLTLRRLVVASTTMAAPESQPSLLLRCISGSIASPQSEFRRLLPSLDLTRGYARGRQSSFSDGEPDFEEDYDEEMDDGYDFSERDDLDLGDDDLDENPWDEEGNDSE